MSRLYANCSGAKPAAPLDALEPLGRVARRVLQAEHFDAALVFVVGEHVGERFIVPRRQLVSEGDGAFERELRPAANREVRGRGGITEEHDGSTGREHRVPPLVRDFGEADPHRRSVEVRAVVEQPVPVERVGEEALAEGEALLLRHPVEPGGVPRLLAALDDERARVLGELIAVRLKPAVLGLAEVERERLERAVRPEPRKPVLLRLDGRLERVGERRSDRAVDAVGGDNEIGPERVEIGDAVLVVERDAECFRPVFEDLQEPVPPDADEPVPGRAQRLAFEVHGDVVPVGEARLGLVGHDGIGGAEVVERAVRKDDAPAERVAARVLLVDGDGPVRAGALEEDREEEAGGASADAGDVHGRRV